MRVSDTITEGTLFLMNSPVLEFNLVTEEFTVLDHSKLPYMLSKQGVFADSMYRWLKRRLPPPTRRDYLTACNRLGISPKDTAAWQKLNYCLFVDDDYWCLPPGETMSWTDVDPRA
jgi:hypothetical protein